jgi:hypothetical protein
MPFKSQAQRGFMHAAESRGQVPKGTAAKWESHTKRKKLPQHVAKTAEQAVLDVCAAFGVSKLANVIAANSIQSGASAQPMAMPAPTRPQSSKPTGMQQAFKPVQSGGKLTLPPMAGGPNPLASMATAGDARAQQAVSLPEQRLPMGATLPR